MANKHQNLDNFFKEKLSGYEAPEKKGNWRLMNHLLDAHERRRKIVRGLLILSSFLVIIISTVFVVIPRSEKNKNANDNNKSNHSLIVPAPPAAQSEPAVPDENKS